MKIVVTHSSPDLDAITSTWLIHRFLPGWEESAVKFVPAGERIDGGKYFNPSQTDPIEMIEEDEVIHVDTGLGPLDHHQIQNDSVCGASLTWEYVKTVRGSKFRPKADESLVDNISGKTDKVKVQEEALSRIVKVVVDIDHFKEVFWPEPNADYQEFGLFGILEGLKIQKPNEDGLCVDFVKDCLDAILHNFENRIWAEREIAKNGKDFECVFGKAIAFETINDAVLKLVQKMGYNLAIRKDPRKGYVRIKARPFPKNQESRIKNQEKEIDLTPVYEKLKAIDPEATWFLHVSKKMLLNGTPKNPKMKPTKLSLEQIIEVIKNV